MREEVSYAPRTSLMRWDEMDRSLPSDGRAWTVVRMGRDPEGLADRWVGELHAAGTPVELERIASDLLVRWTQASAPGWFRHLAAGHRVGWRLAATGEEVGVLRVIALARAAGMLESEVVAVATDRRRSFVYCPHCRHRTLRRQPNPTIACSGCGRELVVHPHVSQTLDAYLGSDRAARERRRVPAAHTYERRRP